LVIGTRILLINDQIKHTTFCAKFRNARCSNLSPFGPNRFVDLKQNPKQLKKIATRNGIWKHVFLTRISEQIRILTRFPAERLGRCRPTRFRRRRRRGPRCGGALRRAPPWDPHGSFFYYYWVLNEVNAVGRSNREWRKDQIMK